MPTPPLLLARRFIASASLGHSSSLTFVSVHSHPLLRLKTSGPGGKSRRSSTGAHEGKGMDAPDVNQLSRMAQITLTEEEVRLFEPQLQHIVEWFSQLQALDVANVPPAVRVDLEDENTLRADVPVNYDSREELLRQVPDIEGDSVKVPRII